MMNSKIKRTLFFVFLLFTLLKISMPTQAEPGAVYELAGSVVGSGGTAVAGSYQTDVIIGQAAVANPAAGAYELGSGFWGGGLVTQGTALLRAFLPFIQR